MPPDLPMESSVSVTMRRSSEYHAFATAYEREYVKLYGKEEVEKLPRQKRRASKRSRSSRWPG